MADQGPWPELVQACLTNSKDKYSQARRWQDGYSDCSSWIGKGMKLLGADPGGSTTLTFLSSSNWVTIPESQIGAGDIAVNSNHCVVVTGSRGAVGQQNPRENVQLGTITDLMATTGPYIFRRYKGGSNVQFAGFSGDSGIEQASSVFSFPGQVTKAFEWMSDTLNWFRVGMVFAGVGLIWITVKGMSKSEVMGMLGGVGKKVMNSAKNGRGE